MRKKIFTSLIFMSIVSLFVSVFSIECVAPPLPPNPDAPTDFTATTISKTRIDLQWIKGAYADITYIERNLVPSWSFGDGKLVYNDF